MIGCKFPVHYCNPVCQTCVTFFVCVQAQSQVKFHLQIHPRGGFLLTCADTYLSWSCGHCGLYSQCVLHMTLHCLVNLPRPLTYNSLRNDFKLTEWISLGESTLIVTCQCLCCLTDSSGYSCSKDLVCVVFQLTVRPYQFIQQVSFKIMMYCILFCPGGHHVLYRHDRVLQHECYLWLRAMLIIAEWVSGLQ